MSATAAPYGLIPVEKQGGYPNQGGSAREFRMTVNVATAMAVGAPVVLGTNGEVTVPAASPTSSTSTPPIGVIVGFSFVDPVMKYELQDSYLPANAINSGYTNIKVYVNDDPDQLYKIQATGTVTRAQIGLNTTITNPQSITAAAKRSSCALTHGSLAAAASTLRLVDFFETPSSRAGDAFTDCIVRWCPGVHAYEKGAGPS